MSHRFLLFKSVADEFSDQYDNKPRGQIISDLLIFQFSTCPCNKIFVGRTKGELYEIRLGRIQEQHERNEIEHTEFQRAQEAEELFGKFGRRRRWRHAATACYVSRRHSDPLRNIFTHEHDGYHEIRTKNHQQLQSD